MTLELPGEIAHVLPFVRIVLCGLLFHPQQGSPAGWTENEVVNIEDPDIRDAPKPLARETYMTFPGALPVAGLPLPGARVQVPEVGDELSESFFIQFPEILSSHYRHREMVASCGRGMQGPLPGHEETPPA